MKPIVFGKSYNKRLFRKSINESFESISNLKSLLNEKMIDILNKSSGGTENWTVNSNWSEAYDYAGSVKEANALIEIFIQQAYKGWNCTLQNLEPGKDVIIKLIDELGFTESENPYIGFIKTFYSVNGTSVTLSEDDWISLNDWYATDVVTAADLKGTGFERKNHLIFNSNLYFDSNVSDNKDEYLKYYRLFSQKSTVMSLNILAIATFDNSPYKALSKLTKDGTSGTGVYQGGDFREVRNIIFYKNSSQPLGDLYDYNAVRTAYTVGKDNHYSAEADEVATGSTKLNLQRNIKETVDNVSKILKNLNKTMSDYIKQYANNNPNAPKRVESVKNQANTYLKSDVDTINNLINDLKKSTNEKEYETVYSKLQDYINDNMKSKKLLTSLGKLSVNKKSGPIKRQNLDFETIKNSFDELSKSDVKDLIKLLRDKGLIK